MKQSFYDFLLVALTTVATTACNPATKYKTEITEIDSCLTVVDSLQTMYDEIPFDSLDLMYSHVVNNEDVVRELYMVDTVNQDVARKLNDAKSVRKAFKAVSVEQSEFKTELQTSKMQLETLKKDIKEGVLTEEQIKQYLGQEKKALSSLELSLRGFYELQNREKSRYYKVVPAVDEFVDQLIAEQKEN